MKTLKRIFVSSAIVLQAFALAQTSIPKDISNEKQESSFVKPILSPKEQLEVNIEKLKKDPILRAGNWGFVVYDTQKKQKIIGYNEETPLIPASTTKLLSTDASMALLGGRFRWITQLEYSGELTSEGELKGNLFLIGSGDPSMGTGKAGALSNPQIIIDYISKISEAGIKKINGDIIVQTAVFQDVRLELPEKIVWIEHNNYYLPVGNTTNIDPKNEKIAVKAKSVFDHSKRYFYVSPYMHKMAFTDKFETNS